MKSVWPGELWRAFLCFGPAGVAGLLFENWAWWLVLASFAYLLLHARSLVRLLSWLGQDGERDTPRASGVWSAVYKAIAGRDRQFGEREQRLSQSIKRYQELSAALPDGAVVLGEHCQIRWFNDMAGKMLGLQHGDRGVSLLHVVRKPELARYLEAGRYKEAVELQSPTIHGCHLQIQLIPYADKQHLLVIRDISRLHHLEQMRTDFVANVSHELRTPLTVLRGCLETLLDDNVPIPAERSRLLNLMQQQTGRMQELVARLLLLSQLESTGQAGSGERVVVANLLYTIQQQVVEAGAPDHRISMEIDEGLGLLGSEVELYSAFSNLVVNAVRYTPAGGKILVHWYGDQDGAHFLVQDTGIGIERRHLPRITERFYRVSTAAIDSADGTGLGLAIVKHVVQRHGGRLEIVSEPHQGSTFTCHFLPARVVHLHEQQGPLRSPAKTRS